MFNPARSSVITVVTALILTSAGIGEASAATSINFDGLATGTQIDSLYSAQGVIFNSVASASGHAYSVGLPTGGNGISLHSNDSTFAAEEGVVEAHFATLQKNVSIDARLVEALEYLGSPRKLPYLQAFGAGGNLIQTTYYDGSLVGTAVSGPWEKLSISTVADEISYVRFSSQGNAAGTSRMYGGIYGEFDNLTFAPAVPEPSGFALMGAGLALIGWKRKRQS